MKNCKDCKFFHEARKEYHEKSQCRLHAPIIVHHGGAMKEVGLWDSTEWPTVWGHTDWCGEFEPKNKAS